jgi:hypothetical protein
MTSGAEMLGWTSWVAVTLVLAATLVLGPGTFGITARASRAETAGCPIDAELWRIIDEATTTRRHDQAG